MNPKSAAVKRTESQGSPYQALVPDDIVEMESSENNVTLHEGTKTPPPRTQDSLKKGEAKRQTVRQRIWELSEISYKDS
ncbi:unnamed protein product [Linum trigynum]|uniref:Uncharacterized protein n=1 Tax=Linum trigynum TaxID=586398 RepID=A0AAV2CIK4_9ROSI